MNVYAKASALDKNTMAALMADPRFEDAAQRVLSLCVSAISSTPALRAESLILAGSLSRGEGIAIDGHGESCFLSDMEFLVATPDASSLAARRRILAETAEKIRAQAGHEGISCEVEFTFAKTSYFTSVRTSIFSCDLSRHGRTVWGSDGSLASLPRPKTEEIPRLDAFYLLCNRIVEQLELLSELENASCPPRPHHLARYAMQKAGIDISTSLLALLGRHEPLLSMRLEALSTLPSKALAGLAPEAERKMREAALLRSDPAAFTRLLQSPGDLREEWRALAGALLSTAKFELEHLRGAGRGDIRALLQWLAESGEWRLAARDRAKIFLRAVAHGHYRDATRLRLTGGRPRHMLYARAIILLATLAGRDKEFGLAAPHTLSLSPFTALNGAADVQSRELVKAWKRHFRNF